MTIPLFKVRMSPKAIENVKEVLESGYIGQGTKVDEFERLLQIELGTNIRPITVNSCTSAIGLALRLIGVDHESEVISTPLTCFASNTDAIDIGARIRWADIDPITGNIDPESVKRLITDKTKAIICVNWAGRICDFKTLKSFGIPVIEDAAHTWDCFYYPLSRGDYVCYSFQAIKFLTTGDGGILICPPEKEEEARLRRWYGLDRTKGENFRCTQNIKIAGNKYHMNDIAASIGIANIEEARKSVEQHMNNAMFYQSLLGDRTVLRLPSYHHACSYWLFSCHVKDGRKEEFLNYMKEKEIGCSPVHYRNDHYDCTKKFKERYLPGVSQFSDTQVCIPVGWWLTSENIDYIIKSIEKF